MFAVTFVVVALCVAHAAAQGMNVTGNPTVPTLEIPKYLGLWYQMYADAVVLDTIEKDNQCVTAKYGDNGDGTVSVHNYATLKAPNGEPTTIDGYAYVPDASKPGQLKVHFDTGAPFDAPYWVLALGPEVNGQYDYSIVSDSTNKYLFVLTRDVARFQSKYDAEVQSLMKSFGFTGLFTKPVATYHGADCVYESTTRAEHTKQVTSGASCPTVSSLDISKYLGLWYQTYADKLVMSTIEPDNQCVTAKYGDNGDGTISVHNYATLKSPTGQVSTIDGYAYLPDATKPGQLLVHFDTGAPFDAAYWVISLGPIVNGQYDYAVVTDSTNSFLFILTRNVATFKSKYESQVLAFVKSCGFTGAFNTPVATIQANECVYESTSRLAYISKN